MTTTKQIVESLKCREGILELVAKRCENVIATAMIIIIIISFCFFAEYNIIIINIKKKILL